MGLTPLPPSPSKMERGERKAWYTPRCISGLFFDEHVKVTLFFYYHKRMHTSHLEMVWPVNR